ncbi:VOC family protein [Ilumatobacter sp.]|uniref:VOC family protein n=1 Tax=Ilumatobacter sp. TaxID=1967498 RepID=UPI003AF7BA65
MGSSVVHLEARGLDAPALHAFYDEVFGWKRNDALSIGDYAVVEIGNGPLTIGIGPVPEWSSRAAKFYVQVDDINATLERVEAAGGKRVMPRTVGPDFGATHILVFTSFLDPAGNEIGLVETPSN